MYSTWSEIAAAWLVNTTRFFYKENLYKELEAETVKKIRNFRLKVPYKKNVQLYLKKLEPAWI